MKSPDGTLHTVQERQFFIPAQALAGEHLIAGDTSFELMDGTPIKENEKGDLVVMPDGPTLAPIDE